MKYFTLTKLLLVFTFTSTLILSCTGNSDSVIIASKNFTENIILAEMMSQIIERHTELEVVRKQNMGTTFIVFSALKSGDIHGYPDYTGTLYQANLKQTEKLDADTTYEYVKREMAKQDVVVQESFGFNNTYAIGLLEEEATKRGLTKISDLKEHPDLVPGFDTEFVERSDGALKMFEYYGLKFDNEIVQMELGLKLVALAEEKVDFTDAFSTDSKLLRYSITILEDDKQFFPPYYAVPVLSQALFDEHPEVEMALAKLSNILKEDEIMQLNYAVEDDKRDVGEVVREFFDSKNL